MRFGRQDILSSQRKLCRIIEGSLVDLMRLISGQFVDWRWNLRNLARCKIAFQPKHFFQDGNGNPVTEHGERYRGYGYDEFMWPPVHGIDTAGIWCQLEGTTCHTVRATLMFLWEKLLEGRNLVPCIDQNWPPRSCDPTRPVDFFLWGYVKARVYKKINLRTNEELKDEIRRVIGEQDQDTCQRMIGQKFVTGTDARRRIRGGYVLDITYISIQIFCSIIFLFFF